MVTSWNWLLLTDFASFKPTYLPEVLFLFPSAQNIVELVFNNREDNYIIITARYRIIRQTSRTSLTHLEEELVI